LATVFGMPIRIHASWLIVFLLITWTLAKVVFPHQHAYPFQPNTQGLGAGWYWGMGVIAALLLFISVLLHELGHSLVARHHHIPVEGITLFLFGGVSQIREEPKSARAEAEVTIAGWAVTATIALLCLFVTPLIPAASDGLKALKGVVGYLAFINVMLLVFNAIPGFPLDGGRLLRAFLWWTTGNLRRSTYIASSVGAAVGLIFIIGGVTSVLLGLGAGIFAWGGAWLALIGLFLRSAAQTSYQQLLIRRALEGVPIGELMSTALVCMPAETLLKDAVDEWFLRYRYHGFPICGPEGLQGVLSLDNVRTVDRDKWENTTVGQVMDRRAPQYAVPPDMDAVQVLARMSRYDVGRIPVVQEGRLIGIVTRRDILELLQLKSDLEKL